MKFEAFIKKLGKGQGLLAVLIDPDKYNPEVVRMADASGVSCFLVGGSRLKVNNTSAVVASIKKIASAPVILFPGDESQLTSKADGLLLLSLLSGRNPEYLIEKHIRAAPLIRRMKLSHLSTAYLLINGGKTSTTQKVTGTRPLDPSNKSYILNTCMAAEQLGFKAIYLEAGSGAKSSVPASLISAIRKHVSIPLIVGGGIRSAASARKLLKAGASMLVVGNALEENMDLIKEIRKAFN